MRVLIVYEDSHRAYGETLQGVIQELRPRSELSVINSQALEAEVESFDPHLVVSSRTNTVDPGGRVAWVTLSEEPEESSEFCLDGERSGLTNPGLQKLLEIIDETEELVRKERVLGGC